MKREIKFRAFYKPNSSMYYFDLMWGNKQSVGTGYIPMLEIGSEKQYGYKDNRIAVDPDDCELMQYTGLKDKKGKEVYEGDILKCAELILSIEFRGGQFVGITNKISQEFQNRNWMQFEVIGNIYETPELLK